jgi:signal transduction histidine kinase
MWRRLLNTLPRGYTLDESEWQRRHRLLLWVLGLHVPALAVVGLIMGHPPLPVTLVMLVPLLTVGLGWVLRRHRRTASVIVTFGLVYCSATLVAFTNGTIEAHFHFFIIIGFIALYQDWAPFLLNIVFTVISHGIGSAWQRGLIFNHVAAQANPWLWSLIHGVAVLFACVGMMLFWRVTEDSQEEKDRLSRQLVDVEIGRRQFTSDLLTNLARRNQSLLYRQLDIINQLEESEQDPDALAELFRLDHMATRVRRNAENLLVLSGEQPPRTWSEPVPLRDVLRAAVAETENLSRVMIFVDEQSAVVGHAVTDLTHLLAELTENAVRFSPPETTVTVRSRPDPHRSGAMLLTVEDWGIGMPPDVLALTNDLLARPAELDLSVSQRLGFHVVARLAARHDIEVTLSATPGSGITVLVRLPPALMTTQTVDPETPPPVPHAPEEGLMYRADPTPDRVPVTAGRRPPPLLTPPSVPSPRPAPAASVLPAAAHAAAVSTAPTRMGLPRRPWDEPTWEGWWDADEPAATTGPPFTGARKATDERPVESGSGRLARRTSLLDNATNVADAQVPTPATSVLRRRTPQAHLAEPLRQTAGNDAVAAPGRSAQAAREAAEALSRYQANRATARVVADQHDGRP